ncbi:TIM barrel protein [Methanosalsum natronophilum]|uniref:TIM barrel protein n=1 Tax=Methanosalsum natronophilum TaxID=768733 RepID=UPI002168981C|nr:TIM barrel protein [Methanosalsum natronophilum]MCS3923978.1 deoxyribonuclease-4 [Methanosalsum natronophilum]
MKQSKILFGTAGIPLNSKKRSSIEGIKYISQVGLSCMELEFVRGVKMQEATASKVNSIASLNKICLSVHAPYFINLNSLKQNTIKNSIQRIQTAAKIGSMCGAHSLVFHPGYYHNLNHSKVFHTIETHMDSVIENLKQTGLDIILRPETTGKKSQFGSLQEVTSLSQSLDGVLPCIDFSHLYARSKGEINGYEKFHEIFSFLEEQLGYEGIHNIHAHISGIEYGDAGEKKHLNLQDSSFDYLSLLKALKDFNVEGSIICESPSLEQDALLLQKEYMKI